MIWSEEAPTPQQRRYHAIEALIYGAILIFLVGLLWMQKRPAPVGDTDRTPGVAPTATQEGALNLSRRAP